MSLPHKDCRQALKPRTEKRQDQPDKQVVELRGMARGMPTQSSTQAVEEYRPRLEAQPAATQVAATQYSTGAAVVKYRPPLEAQPGARIRWKQAGQAVGREVVRKARGEQPVLGR